MKDFFKACNSYQGRWNRKKFWLYPLAMSLLILLPLGGVFILSLNIGITFLNWLTGSVFMIGYIYVIYVSICSYIKRFHDLDRSGHYTWLAFIPYIGIIAVIWCGFFKGSQGNNRFGANPIMTSKISEDNTPEKQVREL